MISRMAKISIIGLGVLGGSYAKGFHNAGYENIYGVDINEETLDFALKQGWIKEGSTDPSIVQDSDIVISALYPHAFIKWLNENQKYFKSGSILTDVTGIKRAVIKEVRNILREDVEFIPCHPMAGREYKGIQYADASLFHSANFIIIKEDVTTDRSLEIAYDIARILEFKHVAELTAEEHDEMIGYLSQLTHVIAISLMNANDNPHLSEYTGDSFRDLTRIAKINEDLWPELFTLNKDYLMNEIDSFVNEMNNFKKLLEHDDIEGMKEKMIHSTERRKYFDK